MKVIVVLPIDKVDPPGEFFGAEAVVDMSQRVEAAGFHGAAVTDHPCPTGRWLDAGGHHAQDPFVMLAFIGAATQRIRLQTGILVMPYRNPFITARSISSLDVMTGGRTIIGVGAGYLKGEYRAVGVDLEVRNDLTDEYLAAWKAAWAADDFSFKGTGYEAVGNRILPRPTQKPHPPIWVGGNSKRAIRRAVQYGDAWAPFHSPTGPVPKTARTVPIGGEADIAEGMAYMRAQMEVYGRKDLPAVVLDSMKAPTDDWNAQALIDQIAGLEQIGVSWVSVHMDGRTRAEWSDNLERYGAEVLSKVSVVEPA
jgi:probable F420-dependent oxidoreductase